MKISGHLKCLISKPISTVIAQGGLVVLKGTQSLDHPPPAEVIVETESMAKLGDVVRVHDYRFQGEIALG
jgi:hypothetical protein